MLTRRLANQIGRAFIGTYGAETGLRMIVRLAARQMLEAGRPLESVQRTLEHCVTNHPSLTMSETKSIATGESRSTAIVRSINAWSAEVFAEAEREHV